MFMLIFQKRSRYLPHIGYEIPRALALHECNHATKLATGWGQRSVSRMMMISIWLKFKMHMFLKWFAIPESYLVCTVP